MKNIYHSKVNYPVAYCHCNSHYGALTVKNLKKHECLSKQCPFLEKYEDHEYWALRKAIKRKKNKKLGGSYL